MILRYFSCIGSVEIHKTQPWVIIPRPIVIQSRLLVEFLRVEEIRRIPDVVALFNEHFAERHILDVLNHLAVKIGDVTAAAQVVWMVVELQLLVCVGSWKLFSSARARACAASGDAVIAAEALVRPHSRCCPSPLYGTQR